VVQEWYADMPLRRTAPTPVGAAATQPVWASDVDMDSVQDTALVDTTSKLSRRAIAALRRSDTRRQRPSRS
jgi:hypothetical protein